MDTTNIHMKLSSLIVFDSIVETSWTLVMFAYDS